MISRMAKPEEVLVVEDDSGHAVKEVMKDGEAVERYHLMRQTVVYLANLDYDDTQSIMREKLTNIMNDTHHLSFQALNTLCWAVGSIAESQSMTPFVVPPLDCFFTLWFQVRKSSVAFWLSLLETSSICARIAEERTTRPLLLPTLCTHSYGVYFVSTVVTLYLGMWWASILVSCGHIGAFWSRSSISYSSSCTRSILVCKKWFVFFFYSSFLLLSR